MTAVETKGDQHQRKRQQLSEEPVLGEGDNKTETEGMAERGSHMGNEEEDI